MSNQHQTLIDSFASLRWYDETIKFVFNFVAKTSELLLAAGVVISSTNFLTDGAIMQDHSPLSIAWAWAQALAIDSSLGVVFVNGFQAARERDKIKATIYFTLSGMLATVAGLLTHFDALSHATGLPVNSQSISGIIPLWMLTALRALAVIGFLLVSRLKNASFSKPQSQEGLQEQEPASTPQPVSIDYTQLATTIVEIMQQRAKVEGVSGEEHASLQLLLTTNVKPEATQAEEQASEQKRSEKAPGARERGPQDDMERDERLAHVYQEIKAEREGSGSQKRISARELASRTNVRRSTCSAWLQAHETIQEQPLNAI